MTIFSFLSYLIDYRVKQIFKFFALLCWHLEMFGVIKCSMSFSLFLGNVSISQINFIANTDFNSIWSLVLFKHHIPYFEIFEWSFVCDIIDHNCTIGIFHVVGYQTSKSLLSCSVPKLYPIVLSISCYIFNMKIDSNCGLHV